MIIDTPGMRELQLWDADEGLGKIFKDVEEAAKHCRFTDCGHHAGTPGCGLQAAMESGALSPERVASWNKLAREIAFLERKQDKRAQSELEKKLRPVTMARRTINLGKEWGNR
jgi:ribosome biogenesis GTPase